MEKKDLIYNYYPVKISDIYNEVYIFSKCGHKEIYKISSLSKKLHLNFIQQKYKKPWSSPLAEPIPFVNELESFSCFGV